MRDRFGCDWSDIGGTQFWRRPQLGRRMFFRHVASAVGGYFLLPAAAENTARASSRPTATARNCIFILMSGGPSHVDTFDFKEGAWTPRDLAPETYGNIRWPRGIMPNLAEHLGSVALLRSMKAWALVHVLARQWVQIGRNPASATARYAPHIGSVASLELGGQDPGATLPAFFSLNVSAGLGAGYFPPQYNPFFLTARGTGLANSTHSDGPSRFDRRYGLLLSLDAETRATNELGEGPSESPAFNEGARRLMYNGDVDQIFTFGQDERNRYGNTGFGNNCIAARNLLRARSGARFIQITQGDWDHHENIWTPNAGHYLRSREFDQGMAALLGDLKADGLLGETLVVALGEFGRVPGPLNNEKGRDHFAQQAALFAGGGVQGGKVIGATDEQGRNTTEPGWVRSRDVRAEDVEATIYTALGIDYTTVRRDDPTGRGFEYVPFSDRDLYGPLNELFR